MLSNLTKILGAMTTGSGIATAASAAYDYHKYRVGQIEDIDDIQDIEDLPGEDTPEAAAEEIMNEV